MRNDKYTILKHDGMAVSNCSNRIEYHRSIVMMNVVGIFFSVVWSICDVLLLSLYVSLYCWHVHFTNYIWKVWMVLSFYSLFSCVLICVNFFTILFFGNLTRWWCCYCHHTMPWVCLLCSSPVLFLFHYTDRRIQQEYHNIGQKFTKFSEKWFEI